MIVRRCKRNDTRQGFTLVELLVVVALMSVLTGMMSVALSSARQDSRIKRTQAEVRTISVILQQKLNDINLAPVSLVGNTSNASNGIEQNRVTMLARRDLMRMTMPQCRADLIYPPARLQFLVSATAASAVKVKQPAEWTQMRRTAGFTIPSGIQIESVLNPPWPSAPFTNPGSDSIALYGTTPALRTALGDLGGYVINLNTAPWPETATPPSGETWTRDYESAECLYLILASTEVFGQRALDQFNARSIANLDGDAVPEIVDPWGVPYEFIRDPVGRNYRRRVTTTLPADTHPDGPDPMDYLRTDFRFQTNDASIAKTLVDDPFRIRPLVISAGPDGEFGFRRSFNREGDFASDRMGISPRNSTAAITLTSVPSFTLPGTFQYPDPYAQLRASSTSPFLSSSDNGVIPYGDLSDATLAGWHGNGSAPAVGLGAAFFNTSSNLEESFGDDIASDDSE